MKRRVPKLMTDQEAEAFLESDLSDLDFSQFKSGRLRLKQSSDSARETRLSPGTAHSQSSGYQRLGPRARKTGERVTTRGRTAAIQEPAPSGTYRLFEQAMAERKQILCLYRGRRREVCPIILGHSQGEEKALTFQFGGESRSGLPRRGEWRCLFLSDVSDVQLREGPWYSGDSHKQPSGCIQVVDLNVNPDSPYNPQRRLQGAPTAKLSGRGGKQGANRRSPHA